jgi:predicted  nucleic acid-binding Zn-ribbon protein
MVCQTMSNLRKKRAQLRGKITRSIKRVRKFIQQGAEMRKRVEKEIGQIHKDFELARECHAEMYEYADESQTSMPTKANYGRLGRCIDK